MINLAREDISFQTIKEGGMEAYEVLFKRYYASLCVVARQILGDGNAAEDVVQEIFIHLWERRANYDVSDLEAFLYVSVKNHCFDFLKAKKNHTVDCDSPEVINRDPIFRDLVIEEETCRMIEEAIDALPAQGAKIVRMALDGKKNKEIAEELGVSVNTVKTLKYRSMEMLRVVLKDYFYILLVLLAENN